MDEMSVTIIAGIIAVAVVAVILALALTRD